MTNIAAMAKALKLSIPTLMTTLNHLVGIGIIEEVTGKRRDRLFTCSHCFNLVSKDTELLWPPRNNCR